MAALTGELRQKILITLVFLASYRIGCKIPLPFIDQSQVLAGMASSQAGGLGQVLGLLHRVASPPDERIERIPISRTQLLQSEGRAWAILKTGREHNRPMGGLKARTHPRF